MFIITSKNSIEKTNDIKDGMDIILNITSNEEESKRLGTIMGSMTFGDILITKDIVIAVAPENNKELY